jgi:ribosomal protein L16 Arg81 hydroxylase
MGATSAVDRMREEVSKKLIDELRKNVPDTAAKISAQITERFGELQSCMDASLRIYIHEVKGQVETILKEKEEGEARVRAEQERLAAARQALVSIAKQLEAIRNEIDTVAEP